MDAIRITATFEDGTTVTGPIQGMGGIVGDPARAAGWVSCLLAAAHRIHVLRRELQRSCSRHSVFEPRPRWVRLYPWHSAAGNGPPVDVPLAEVRLSIRVELGHRPGCLVVEGASRDSVYGYTEGTDRASGNGPFDVGAGVFRKWLEPAPAGMEVVQ